MHVNQICTIITPIVDGFATVLGLRMLYQAARTIILQFDSPPVIDHTILRFQVAVYFNVTLMQEIHALEHTTATVALHHIYTKAMLVNDYIKDQVNMYVCMHTD